MDTDLKERSTHITVQTVFGAITAGDESTVAFYIKEQGGLNLIDPNSKQTLLEHAIREKQLRIAILLSEAGADCTYTSRERFTYLHLIVRAMCGIDLKKGEIDLAIQLASSVLQHGASISWQDRRGNTILNYLAQRAKSPANNSDWVERFLLFLVEADPKFSEHAQIRNNMGKIPFYYISRANSARVRALASYLV